MIKFVLWCILLALCWPLALLAPVLYPFVWLFLLPFRLVGIAVPAALELVKETILLPARLLRSSAGPDDPVHPVILSIHLVYPVSRQSNLVLDVLKSKSTFFEIIENGSREFQWRGKNSPRKTEGLRWLQNPRDCPRAHRPRCARLRRRLLLRMRLPRCAAPARGSSRRWRPA